MQAVSPAFNQRADGDMRPITWGSFISFDKTYDEDITWFTLDQSLLNGTDVLGLSEDNPLLPWGQYEYQDYSERLVYMSVERSLEFPYSVVSAIAERHKPKDTIINCYWRGSYVSGLNYTIN